MEPATSTPRALPLLGVIAAASITLGAVAFIMRRLLYESIAGGAFNIPALHALIDLVASKGLLVLVAITVIVVVVAWRRGIDSFVQLVAAGVGTIAAYGASEIIKVLVEQQRPCRALPIDTITPCPSFGDWSWPSNHSTIAAALAASCVFVVPRIWPLVAPIALVIALSRVAAGVHYPHDIITGLALGIIITLAIAIAVNPLLSKTVKPMRGLTKVRDHAESQVR